MKSSPSLLLVTVTGIVPKSSLTVTALVERVNEGNSLTELTVRVKVWVAILLVAEESSTVTVMVACPKALATLLMVTVPDCALIVSVAKFRFVVLML